MSAEFHDHTDQVLRRLDDNVYTFLKSAADEAKSAAMENVRVATGKTRGSYDTRVSKKGVAYIGSSDKNAIYEEFGTGEYALKGGGRKDTWSYYKDGKWHKTSGKKPTQPLKKAAEKTASQIPTLAERIGDGF